MSFPHFAALHKMLNKARNARPIILIIGMGWDGMMVCIGMDWIGLD